MRFPFYPFITNIFSFVSLGIVIIATWKSLLANSSIWVMSETISLITFPLDCIESSEMYPGHCEKYVVEMDSVISACWFFWSVYLLYHVVNMAGLKSQSLSPLQWVAAKISVEFFQPQLGCEFVPCVHSSEMILYFPHNFCAKFNVSFSPTFLLSLISPSFSIYFDSHKLSPLVLETSPLQGFLSTN